MSKITKIEAREHVLKRPDMYIGSIEPDKSRQWLVNDSNTLHISEIMYCPGLFKIFDEIITNASDNKQNDNQRVSSRKQTYIKVEFNKSPSGMEIIVENNGIQNFVEKSKQKGYQDTWIPELAFGILMTSSNYDDNEERVTGGRNGYGAKLTNIYSKRFIVEIVENGQYYRQVWTNNMAKKTEVEVTKYEKNKSDNFIRISFIPDYEKFQMNDMTDDMLQLLRRRVYDIAGCTDNVKVYLNRVEVPIHGFHQYCQAIFNAACPEQAKELLALSAVQTAEKSEDSDFSVQSTSTKRAKRKTTNVNISGPLAALESSISYFQPNTQWTIAVFQNEMKEFQQLSFVNSINTIEGGSHVDYFIDELPEPINEQVKTYLKQTKNITMGKELTKAQIKSNIFVLIRCLVVNPSFDSQTKVCLKTTRTLLKKAVSLAPTTTAAKQFYKSLGKNTKLMESLASQVSNQINKLLQKTDGSKAKTVVVPKLDDAICAGTAQSQKCSLYLTEGDSAKTLAVEGISKLVDGRKYNGCFPLRGKVLNVREQTVDKVSKNEEITNLKKIIGLKQGMDYSTAEARKNLRYGHVVLMTDQDTDGSHIKGLLLNLFDSYWPSLIKCGFIEEFITPIVRVEKLGGRRTGDDKIDFYTLPQFHEWLAQTPNTKGWKISYYKGLGSSDKKQAAEYFKNVQNLKKGFIYDKDSNVKINMAFNKKLADERKKWLTGADPNTFLDNSQEKIKVTEFIDKELVLYELENIGRSIPSVFDGLKPSQRKIVFSCFKRKLTKEIKVAQLSGYVSEHSAYHHGEVSLQETIVSLAQTFVGANNIALLVPQGQFGSRPRGGKDSAAARYIHTFLQPITRYIFIESDDQTLHYLNDDGQLVEPEYYLPIIPMILVNGSKGIATGWSTNVPQFNPKDLIDFIRRKLYKKSTKSLRYGKDQILPWYRDFTGETVPEFKDKESIRLDRVIFKGKIEIDDDDQDAVLITELPVGKWTEEYREQLISWMTDDKEKEKDSDGKTKGRKVGQKLLHPSIIAVNDYSDNDTVNIQVICSRGYLRNKSNDELMDLFQLSSSMKMTNMTLHDSTGKLKQYQNAGSIIDDFYVKRMEHYDLRKKAILEQLEEDKIVAENKARFIQMIIDQQLNVRNVKIGVLSDKLWELKFMPQKTNRLLLLSKKNVDLEDSEEMKEQNQLDDADKHEAEKLLKENTKDITDQNVFFSTVQKPAQQQLNACYSYLTRLAIQTMTAEKYQELISQKEQAEAKYEDLKHKTIEQLYLYDLAALDLALEEYEINLEHADTGKQIDVKNSAIKTRMEEVEKEYNKYDKAEEDSDEEPVLLEKEKVSKKKAKSEEKAKKEVKEEKETSRPSLLVRSGKASNGNKMTSAMRTIKKLQGEKVDTPDIRKKQSRRKKQEESYDDYSDESGEIDDADLISDSEIVISSALDSSSAYSDDNDEQTEEYTNDDEDSNADDI